MRSILITFLTLFGTASFGHSGDDGIDRFFKPTDDDDRQFTNIGRLGLTITNFGTVGTRNFYWPNQPSCEYPLGSRIEHIYQGGLWVGAVSRSTGQQHVSTGAHDRLFSSEGGEGPIRPEFTSEAGEIITQRSSLSESQFFDEKAISHQDFVARFSDLNRRSLTTGDTLFKHEPLGIVVHQESYAWNFPFADFFVILNYTIYNVDRDTLDSVYVGLWADPTIRNTNNVRPGTPGYFTRKSNGYTDSLRMAYAFDYDGSPTPPAADSYLGIKLLGSTPFPRGVDSLADLKRRTYYNAWRFRDESGQSVYRSPADDAGTILNARSRYARLASSLPNGSPPDDYIDQLRTRPDNMTVLLSTGPFATLNPGDSLNVVFGIICARKFGTAPARDDTPEQRKTLVTNAGFCQQAYDGEDVNGNNILDPGEDVNGNGILDHFTLPQPPRPPKIRVEVESQSVLVYWDKSTSESSVDPITREQDFEGYRIYRSNPGADFTNPEDLLLTLTQIGEFDVPGNDVGYNTGFSQILLDAPKFFPGDTVAYWYRFPPADYGITHLNGWQYLYGVAAFDRGDTATGITSLQSKTEVRRVIPGTLPTSDPGKDVRVYPNPYYAGSYWDGSGERNRKIYFYNLPSRCEIRIYTLAGDVVAELQHDASSYDGTDIEWFRRFGGIQISPQFAGGEHAWDLVTKFDQAISTGLYLFSVKDLSSGEIKTGKFLVIK
jgi:hypothetical protein